MEFLSKTKELVYKQEKALEAKYHYMNKGRIFRPSNTHNFEYNDPLRVYFNLIEYGMNRDITFQKNLIELLKKKGLVDDTKDKESSILFPQKTLKFLFLLLLHFNFRIMIIIYSLLN